MSSSTLAIKVETKRGGWRTWRLIRNATTLATSSSA
jgi:hypothetical protein